MENPISFDFLSVPDTIGRVVHILWNRWVVFAQLAAVAVLPLVAFMAMFKHIVTNMILSMFRKMEGNNEDYFFGMMQNLQEEVKGKLPHIASLIVVYIFLYFILTIAGRAAMVRATAELYVDQEP